MRVKSSRTFQKNYTQRIAPYPSLVTKFQQRLELLITEPHHPILHNHKLMGKRLSFSAFAVTGDIRVIYKIVDEIVLLVDVGSHNQVY